MERLVLSRVAFRSDSSQVRHFGDDVTVRYFTPKSIPVRAAIRDGEVRHISEDVTVRYFRTKNTASDGQSVGSGGAQAVVR